MKPSTLYSLAGAFLLMLALTLAWGHTSGLVVGLAGFLFVLGGTLATSMASNSLQAVLSVLQKVPLTFKRTNDHSQQDAETLLQVTNLYRWSNIRRAEATAQVLNDPLLRMGAQMVLDRTPREDLVRTLQRYTLGEQEQDRREIGILQSMATFAPAFGMLGTLLGLLHLLFGLGDSGLDAIGQSMGFAMMTTVFGLILANLLIKPIIIKLEQYSRERLTRKCLLIDALLMLHDRRHPAQIAESLEPLQTLTAPTAGSLQALRTIADGLVQA